MIAMNRTFSLQRLLLNVAIFAVLCGFITAFPSYAVRIAVAISVFLPAIAISVVFSCCSRHAKLVLAVSLIGIGCGWLLSPTVLANWTSPPTWWDIYLINLYPQLASTVIGAVFFGGPALAWSRLQSQPGKSLHPAAGTSGLM